MTTILVVEDDETLAYLIARHCEAAGYEVIPASSTMTALDVLDSERRIDLLLADIVMPSGQPNGFALGRMARVKRLGIKVLFITGYDDLGIDDLTFPAKIFRKPIDCQSLIAEIGAQLSAS